MQADQPDSSLRERVRRAAVALKAGALVVVPTDTVYGVAADARVPGAIERIYLAKQRDRGKPIAVLVSDMDRAVEFGARMSPAALKLAARFWPGPLTMVLPVSEDRYEGFRAPNHPVALALLREMGGALYVTSANISGRPPAATARDAADALGSSVEVVLDGGPAPGGVASTVVKVEGDRVSILRDGAIPGNEIESCLGR